jgi:hypothetical protein
MRPAHTAVLLTTTPCPRRQRKCDGVPKEPPNSSLHCRRSGARSYCRGDAVNRAAPAFTRHAIGAKIGGLRRTPESARAGFRVGARRVASADSGMRPPGSRHVAAVDGIQSTVGMAPKDAVCTTGPDRQRSGGDAFAAPLPAVGLRPVRDLFWAVRRFRRVAAAQPLILSLLEPKGTAGAVQRRTKVSSHGFAMV